MSEMNRIDPRVLGQRLSDARKACGKTQEEAAAHLGCSRPTLIAIEKGNRPARSDEIVKLAGIYGRSLHEMVRPGLPNVPLVPHLRAAVDPSRGNVEELNNAIGELQRFADDYRELERLLNAPLLANYPDEVHVPSRVKLVELAEDAAIRERTRLGLGDEPILRLRRLLENDVGLRVFYGAMPSAVAGMYAFVGDLGYCILINSKHPPERRRATLAHEYGHFLCDRHKPGFDYLTGDKRKPASDRFAEAFAMRFLIPETGVRRKFLVITRSTGDFQVADLCRLSNFYFVSVQAMAFRLEGLGLIGKGSWNLLMEKGFKARAAKEDQELSPHPGDPEKAYPERYKFLAVQAFCQEKISEGQLARFLRCDRVTAREILAECVNRLDDVDANGNTSAVQMLFQGSLLKAES